MMTRGAISRKVSSSQIIITSIMEAKCVACCNITYEIVWLRNMTFGFEVVKSTSRTLIICCDNAAIMNFSQMIIILLVQSVLINK